MKDTKCMICIPTNMNTSPLLLVVAASTEGLAQKSA